MPTGSHVARTCSFHKIWIWCARRKQEAEKERKEGRRRRSGVNERGPAFSRHYSSFLPSSPFPFLASVDNKMILRITDGAVKKDLSIFDVNWTCEGLLEIVFESCDQCSQMLGIFPIPGISIQFLGQNFDHWEIPKTHKSLGILISGTKIRIPPLKSSKNAQFRLKYHPCLKIL